MIPGARPKGFDSQPARKVVFLCVMNSARSQIAEGLARRLAPEGTQVWSAGLESSRVHPMAIQVMEEAGIDIRAQTSKRLEDIPWREADTVVTLCGEAEEACPHVAAEVRRIHWPLPDPSRAAGEAGLQAFREVRDELRWRLTSLWPPGA